MQVEKPPAYKEDEAKVSGKVENLEEEGRNGDILSKKVVHRVKRRVETRDQVTRNESENDISDYVDAYSDQDCSRNANGEISSPVTMTGDDSEYSVKVENSRAFEGNSERNDNDQVRTVVEAKLGVENVCNSLEVLYDSVSGEIATPIFPSGSELENRSSNSHASRSIKEESESQSQSVVVQASTAVNRDNVDTVTNYVSVVDDTEVHVIEGMPKSIPSEADAIPDDDSTVKESADTLGNVISKMVSLGFLYLNY